MSSQLKDVLNQLNSMSTIDDKEKRQISSVIRRLEDTKYGSSALCNMSYNPHQDNYIKFLTLVASEASKEQNTSVVNFIRLLLEATTIKEDEGSLVKEIDVTTIEGQQILKEIRKTIK